MASPITSIPDENSKPTAPSLSGLAFKEICRQLETFVEGKRASASFVCGGLVPIDKNIATGSISPGNSSVSPPVRICWRTKAENIPRDLDLPLDHTTDPNMASEDLHQLIRDCDPASFGRGQEDVIDPEYRKAGKLEPGRFVSTFHPSDFGILQNVEQILLPNFSTELQNSLPFRKLVAELYKLNVYSGPSGLFRKHVDTPRSKSQIGSLVICLPSPFKGGNLLVQHEGKEVEFDWSHQSASAIQWAAFYSDCEHEIKTIKEGERITLTYNLYVTQPERSTLPSVIVDPKSLSLYGFLKHALMEPGFMKHGGSFGFFCSHAYPHTSDEAQLLLPRALKGADLVLYSVLKSLGVRINVVPVVVETDYDSDDSYYYNEDEKETVHGNWVGYKLRPYETTCMGMDMSRSQILQEAGSGKFRPEIVWIGSPTHRKRAMTHVSYGNEPSLGTIYSYAAMIAEIPPFMERQSFVGASTS